MIKLIWNALEMIGDKENVNKRKLKKTQVLRQWGRFSKGRQLLNYKKNSRGERKHKQSSRGRGASAKFTNSKISLPKGKTTQWTAGEQQCWTGWVEDSCPVYYDKGETFRPGRGVKSQLVQIFPQKNMTR